MNARPPRHAMMRAPIAPIHRGPQALPSAGYVSSGQHAPNAALLIDFDNVTMGIRSDLASELRSLLSSDIIKGKVAVQRAYADWRRYPQYIVPLAESSIDMIMAPAYGSSKKNATDIRLAVDAIELVFTRSEIGTYILLSGDSDFASLVTKLKEYGKYVIGVGIRESSSDLLVMNCDEYYSYNALAGLVKASEEEVVKWDPWELVAEAISRMQKNGDVMRSDRLKQVMQDIDASFDEKNHGYSKFSKFVSDAADKGLVTVTKLENGQFEVGPSATAPAQASAAPRPAAPAGDDEAAREERSRRGRRGGRGRGRDREERGQRDERPPRETAGEHAVAAPSSPAADEREAETKPAGSAAAPHAAAAHAVTPHTPASHASAPHVSPQRSPASAAASHTRGPVAEAADHFGLSGERLTRQEAFDIVRRAASSLVAGDGAVLASAVRDAVFAQLGRDSESLSRRNFDRILRDAHDAGVIDLRRRGDDFEVALAAVTVPVSEQLNRAAAAHTAAVAASAPVAPPTPRGMGPRGIPARGRSPGAGRIAVPPELLMVGVVDDTSVLPTRSEISETVVEASEPAEGKGRAGRGRPRAKRETARSTTRPPAAKETKPKAKGAKPRVAAGESKSPAGESASGGGGAKPRGRAKAAKKPAAVGA